MSKRFADFGIRQDTLDSLQSVGIDSAFEIQELTLPSALAGQDIIGQAKTGTGKTFAFGLPLLEKIEAKQGKPAALIVLPTRELAIQVQEELLTASSKRADKLRITLLYGGSNMDKQIAELQSGADIIVGTPGRILDLQRRGDLDLSDIHYFVLDEADQMLNFGFIDDVEFIASVLPAERQTLLFSATMPAEIRLLALKFMHNPVHISTMGASVEGGTVDNITNFVYRAHPMDKPLLIAKILQMEGRQKTIIFTRMKYRAAELADDLRARGFKAIALHGDMKQEKREKSMAKFKEADAEHAPILVATDVAARGLDIDDVSVVINYECPDDKENFLHRTGRTGRAGEKGIAITLTDWEDMAKWKSIAEALKIENTEPEETYSSGDEWKSELRVPLDAKAQVGEPLPPKYSKKKVQSKSKGQNSHQGNSAQRNKGQGNRDQRNNGHKRNNNVGHKSNLLSDMPSKRRKSGTRQRNRVNN